MDTENNTCNLCSFNCKSLKRSIEGIRELCKTVDVLALQETWLLPHDLALLNNIDINFGCTGASAVDTSKEILTGRPYGGVALLWRKSLFPTVSVIECNNPRMCAVKIKTEKRSFIVFSVYMPVNTSENLPIFTECLGLVSSVIEDNIGCESVFILGDFNAHPKELFCHELLNFCHDQCWSCIDIDMLGMESGTYTFISDAHGCGRWLDHCIVTEAARHTVKSVCVKQDVYWSDHFPVLIECNISELNMRCVADSTPPVYSKVVWGERGPDQIKKYSEFCHNKLNQLSFPLELDSCANTLCSNSKHKLILNNIYCKIIDILTQASEISFPRKFYRKNGYIAGWNKYVAEAHRHARNKFKAWCTAGKPRNGEIYIDMAESRKYFKTKLKWCQDHQDQIKMDILASNRKANDFKSFWKNVTKINPRPGVPVSVEGISEAKDIANSFKDHFTVRSSLGSYVHREGKEEMVIDQNIKFTAKEIDMLIKRMQRGKSPGHDGLSIEHFKYAGAHLPELLARFFTMCLSHSYLPPELMKTIVVPIVKNKTGDVSSRSNYRPISLATITAKVLDSLLNGILGQHLKFNDAQFGFRAGLSTESAILCLKHTIRYYTDRETPVYACFLDLSKAFDLVKYDILWNKLGTAGVPAACTLLLKHWYNNQVNQVRWANNLSDEYKLECGVRQGGLTSPSLFNLYMDALIGELSSTHVGCFIDGTCFNNLSYADDMVLLAPSINALRKLIEICERYASGHGLRYNTQKSEVMVFRAGRQRPRVIPPVTLGGNSLKVVSTFKYLGHMITDDLKDKLDIERERRALAVRCNMLARRFARSSKEVKVSLFRAFCQTFYSSSLWVRYTLHAYNVLRVQYNNAFRVLLGLPRYCSASGMFVEARVDGFHAIMRKRVASMLQRVRASTTNSILNAIASRYDCPIQKHWVAVVTGKL